MHYAAAGTPMLKAQCHCRECHYITGGGPNYFMILPASGFSWTKGPPQKYVRDDLETPVARCFCATCGTHIITELPVGEWLVIKVGTLDDPSVYGGPKLVLYTIDQQPFHLIADGIPSFEGLP